MKQNVKNLKQQHIYRRRRTVLVVILLLLLALIIAVFASTNNVQNVVNISNSIGDIDLSKITSKDPNPPTVGAGMIPIKWNGTNWVITTKENSDWYDYGSGKWANVMLSDGYYKSELEIGIDADKQLVSKVIANNNETVVLPEQMGTVFTWIPRLAYYENQVEFLKETSVIDYKWTTERCFNLEKYGANYLDLAFDGIWVGQKEYANASEVTTKNEEMNSEENIQGLTANEKVAEITASDKIAVQKLYAKTVGVGVPDDPENVSVLQNIDKMTNRQTIKIVNTNKRLPIVGENTVNDNNIIISSKYHENNIKCYLDEEGNILPANIFPINKEEVNYKFYIVDELGNIRRYSISYGSGAPYLKGFNKSNTFYVTYDAEGNESSYIPIGENMDATDWYDYENQKWANIVVRENGNENYYTWIPRYMYKLDAKNERVDAKFVNLDNVWTNPETGEEINLNNSEYKLLEAFTWENPDDANDVVQLTGFWAAKYKLRDGVTYSLDGIYGSAGKIQVNNILKTFGTSNKYYAYVIKDGKIVAEKEIVTDSEKITKLNDGSSIEGGEYSVNIIIKDSTGKHIQGITKKITVLEGVKANEPVLEDYNNNLTFYVAMDNNGNEISNIPIGENSPENWYDYDEDKNANIVVRENGIETYYEWIPRYQYLYGHTDDVSYILPTKTEADSGYVIPDEFKDNNLPGYWNKVKEEKNRITVNVASNEKNIIITNITPAPSETTKIYISVIKDGKIFKEQQQLSENSYTYSDLNEGTYAINIMAYNANDVMISGYTEEEVLYKIKVDLQGFNKNNTFYVLYDENGNEDSSIPIGEDIPENWYSYENQKWANIVVRDNGNENYYTWIPRYEYKLNSSLEKANAIFIPASKIEADPGYTIPEAFTWEDPNDSTKVIHLSGFWAAKYKLRDASTQVLGGIYGAAGVVYINNIIPSETTNTYEAYLIQNGKIVATKTITGSDNKITKLDNGSNLPKGEYTVNIIVKDSTGKQIQGIAKTIEVYEKIQPYKPDLTKYNNNITYYVMYNIYGEEGTSTIPVGTTSINISEWYDYDEDRKATIVVRENGTQTYYEWIPRYQCDKNDPTHISYINVDVEPNTGWEIPAEFTGENAKGYWRQKETRDSQITANIAAGKDKIKISNIESSVTSVMNYDIYLIKDGVIIDTKSTIGSTCEFTGLTEGKYAVEIVKTNDTVSKTLGGMAKDLRVIDVIPDLTGFNEEMTYYVTYDDSGNETLTKITETEPTNWYDYSEQKWANIVVKDDVNNTQNYFVWIPRYEYKLNSKEEKTNVLFIPKTQETADEGYVIPEAFTWEDPNDATGVIQLPGFWAAKYKLR